MIHDTLFRITAEQEAKVRAFFATQQGRRYTFALLVNAALESLAPDFNRLYGPTKPPAVWEYDHQYELVPCARCADPYFRHFDGYEEHSPAVGCKWCECDEFVFPNDVNAHPQPRS